MNDTEQARRRLLLATTAAGGVTVAAAGAPLVASLTPSARARAAGAPVEVDIAALAPGEMMTVAWRGKPVWILHRSAAMLAALERHREALLDPDSERPMQPDYAAGPLRSIRPEYLVLVGICTHLGCSPSARFKTGADSGIGADWPGGFLCLCHGSTFDLAGRVYRNKPAPDNLEVPPHRYLSGTRLLIGDDGRKA